MPQTIENLLNCHQIAQERRDAGRPIWDYQLDIQSVLRRDPENDEPEYVISVACEIAKRLKRGLPSAWFDPGSFDYSDTLSDIVQELSEFRTRETHDLTEDLNYILDELYDWADAKRVSLGV